MIGGVSLTVDRLPSRAANPIPSCKRKGARHTGCRTPVANLRIGSNCLVYGPFGYGEKKFASQTSDNASHEFAGTPGSEPSWKLAAYELPRMSRNEFER